MTFKVCTVCSLCEQKNQNVLFRERIFRLFRSKIQEIFLIQWRYLGENKADDHTEVFMFYIYTKKHFLPECLSFVHLFNLRRFVPKFGHCRYILKHI